MATVTTKPVAQSSGGGVLGRVRQSSAGVTLGRKIFDPAEQTTLQPTQITHILKQLGVNIPPGVAVTADVAQIIMAGGALSSAISQSKNLNAFIQPSVSILSSALDIFEVTGLLDPNSPEAQIATFGLDAALVVSSGGLNVFADIAFVFDLFKGIFMAEDTRARIINEVRFKSQSSLRNWYNSRQADEQKAAASAFSDYHNGKLSVFEYIAKVADVAPDQFLGYFPDFKGFVPVMTLQHCVSVTEKAHYGGFLGIGRTYVDETSKSCTSIQNTLVQSQTPAQQHALFENVFYQKYFEVPFAPYIKLAGMSHDDVDYYGYPPNAQKNLGVVPLAKGRSVYPRISPMDLAVFSLMPPYASFIHDDFDITQVFLKYSLTPDDLGYSLIKDQMAAGRWGGYLPSESPGLTINGIQAFSDPQVSTYDQKVAEWNPDTKLALQYDEAHDAKNLFKIPNAKNTVTEWGILPYLPSSSPELQQGNYANMDLKDPMGYRNIQNFWSAISTLEKISNDPFFKGTSFQAYTNFFPSRSDLEKRHQTIQTKAVGRMLNEMARANVATYFGLKDSSKLKFKNTKPGQLVAVDTGVINVR